MKIPKGIAFNIEGFWNHPNKDHVLKSCYRLFMLLFFLTLMNIVVSYQALNGIMVFVNIAFGILLFFTIVGYQKHEDKKWLTERNKKDIKKRK